MAKARQRGMSPEESIERLAKINDWFMAGVLWFSLPMLLLYGVILPGKGPATSKDVFFAAILMYNIAMAYVNGGALTKHLERKLDVSRETEMNEFKMLEMRFDKLGRRLDILETNIASAVLSQRFPIVQKDDVPQGEAVPTGPTPAADQAGRRHPGSGSAIIYARPPDKVALRANTATDSQIHEDAGGIERGALARWPW